MQEYLRWDSSRLAAHVFSMTCHWHSIKERTHMYPTRLGDRMTVGESSKFEQAATASRRARGTCAMIFGR